MYKLTNCIWNDTQHTSFDCVWAHPKLGKIPFTALSEDPEKHGRDLFAWAVEHCKIAEPDSGKLLADAKATALAELEAAIDREKNADIAYKGVAYQADGESEKALNDRISVLQASGKIDTITTWIAADNSQHELSFSDLAGIAYAIAERCQAIVLETRAKKDVISQAETPEVLAKVDSTL